MRRLSARRGTRGQPERSDLDPLVVSGFAEVAAGALTGWLYTVAKYDKDRARAIGVKSAERVKQLHLDLIMLGGLTALAGTAVRDIPPWVRWPLGIGAWTNATAFLPLAFAPGTVKNPVYRAAVGASFVSTSVGFTGLAVTAARRRSGYPHRARSPA